MYSTQSFIMQVRKVESGTWSLKIACVRDSVPKNIFKFSWCRLQNFLARIRYQSCSPHKYCDVDIVKMLPNSLSDKTKYACNRYESMETELCTALLDAVCFIWKYSTGFPQKRTLSITSGFMCFVVINAVCFIWKCSTGFPQKRTISPVVLCVL